MTGSGVPPRWRRTISDATFLYLLPLLIAVLPWRAGFAVLRRISRSPRVFADVVEAAWKEASRSLPALDRERFCQRHRLLLLVDRCDTALCTFRSSRWWQRQVDVIGDPLDDVRAGALLFSHWGNGNPMWALLAAHGLPAHLVSRRAEVADVGRSWLSRGYLGWRAWAICHAGCKGVIYTGGASAHVLECLGHGGVVLSTQDMPVPEGRGGVPVQFLGHQTWFRSGLTGLALRSNAPITLLSCGLDMRTGRRRLHVEVLPDGLDAEVVLKRYTAHLEKRIETEPAQWHVWPQASAYFAVSASRSGQDSC